MASRSLDAAKQKGVRVDEGKLAKVWTGVKPQEHSDEILAALDELEKK